MINANDSVNNHFKVHRSASLLDVLIEFDKFLDDLNVYSYENWLDGEIVDGHQLDIGEALMFPWENDPGGERLLGKKCKVYYKEDYYLEPREVKTPDDYEQGTRKPKADKIPVWVVKIKLPKKYVLTYDRTEADQEELAKGFQQGLDDETRQSGNAETTDI